MTVLPRGETINRLVHPSIVGSKVAKGESLEALEEAVDGIACSNIFFINVQCLQYDSTVCYYSRTEQKV